MARRFDIHKRFWSKVRKGSSCWEWIACKDDKGYGRFYKDGKQTFAHRTVLELSGQQVPNDKFVCHQCDNPGCVNPDHLFVGTCADNLRDMAEKGRSTIGEKNPRAKLCETDVLLIRDLESSISRRSIADWFDVAVPTVYAIHKRTIWTHI
jgi:hypothetical protein